jgi:6-phosphogluconolactonase
VIRVDVLDDADQVASRGAVEVAVRAREAVADHGRFLFAVSGGRTPWEMFAALREEDVPWERLEIYQVDERVAPPGDPDRNLTHLMASLPPSGAVDVHPLPVNEPDLEVAAARYAASLPPRFDLIHLGLGADGHTASLVPGDPALNVTDRDVAVTDVYQGHRRMTLTYPVLDRAAHVLFLVSGAEKTDALRRLRAADPSIPAGRIGAADQLVLCDRASAG